MNNMGDAFEGTQQLSQSIYESIILRSKSTSVPEQEEEEVDETGYQPTETQHTLNDGDEGHVDITSSFVTHREDTEQGEESEPVDFSPTQTQQQLTQYPESQRFKTPATAGKKRRYNGDTIETPSNARNPLARNHEPTPGKLMDLSQVFAGTQAASSPFSNGLPTGPRSDRPSPNIDLQTRPAANSSSPLRPLSTFKRAVTEPATRYVPMQQSQSERERQAQLRIQEEVGNEDYDDFEDESSIALRTRREKEREARIREQLKAASSPVSPDDVANEHSLSENEIGRSTHERLRNPIVLDHSDPEFIPGLTNALQSGSEAETEQEDEGVVDVRRSSQPLPASEEDKENQAFVVRDTIARPNRHTDISVSQVEASPSLRHTANSRLLTDLHSSEPVRIADSQPSRERKLPSSLQARGTKPNVVLSSTPPMVFSNKVRGDDEAQNIPHPDREPIDESAKIQSVLMSTGGMSDSKNFTDDMDVEITGNGTVPETISDMRVGESSTVAYTNGQEGSTNNTSTHFETAASHIPVPQGSSSSLVSSQPPFRTPPRRRRRRMEDISADPSPLKSQSSFNARDVLQLDPDQDMVGFLETTPSNKITYGSKRRKLVPSPVRLRDPSEVVDALTSLGPPCIEQVDVREDQVKRITDVPDLSQDIVRPTRQRAFVQPVTKRSQDIPGGPRGSIFDFEASPEKHERSSVKHSKKLQMKKSLLHGRANSIAQPDTAAESSAVENSTVVDDQHSISLVINTAIAPEGSSNGEADAAATEITAPNMVFACFNGKIRAYYPAICLGPTSNESSRYRIQWEGYAPDEVDAHGVKGLDLRIDDVVKVNLDGFPKIPYIVRGFKDRIHSQAGVITNIRGYQTLIVTPKTKKSLPPRLTAEPRKEVPVAAIYLDTNLWQQMKTRTFNFVSSSTLTEPGYTTPVDRAASPTTPSSRSRRQTNGVIASVPFVISTSGIFANMVFAMSYDDPNRKNSLVDAIQSNGGVVITDSFHDLLEPDRVDLRAQFADLGFTALLTERHSRKEKYMQALALGLPCLSGRWIESCISENTIVDWQTYLLPAGESVELDGATRSRTLPDMDCSSIQLSEMLRGRPKLLDDASVMVVMGRGKAEVKRAPYVFLLRALGAGRIEKVADVKAAKEFVESDTSIQWVFVDDRDLTAAEDLFRVDETKSHGSKRRSGVSAATLRPACHVAGNELIVQSLILSKLYKN